MNNSRPLVMTGIVAVLVGTVLLPLQAAGIEKRGTMAPKHDSNSLHKLGNAIQYPFRKAGENASVNTHRGTRQNSVVKNQKYGSTEVVKPSGNKVVIGRDNPRIGWTKPNQRNRYMHRRQRNFTQQGRKYYWFNNHRYYLDLRTGDRVKID